MITAATLTSAHLNLMRELLAEREKWSRLAADCTTFPVSRDAWQARSDEAREFLALLQFAHKGPYVLLPADQMPEGIEAP